MHEERTEELRAETAELYKQGRMQEIVDKINEVGTDADDDYDLQSVLGSAYSKLGRAEEALSTYKTALRLRPNAANAFYQVGGQLAQMGRIDEARPMIEQALLADPKHEGALNIQSKIGDAPAKAVGATDWEKDHAPTHASDAPSVGISAKLPGPIQKNAGILKEDFDSQRSEKPKVYGPPRIEREYDQEDHKPSPLIPMLTMIVLVAVTVAGYFTYQYWQKQQGPEGAFKKLITAEFHGDKAVVKDLLYIDASSVPGGGDPDTMVDKAAEQMVSMAAGQNEKQAPQIIKVDESKDKDQEKATIHVGQDYNLKGASKHLEYDVAMLKKDGKWKMDVMITAGNILKASGINIPGVSGMFGQ